MFKKVFCLLAISFLAFSKFLTAGIEYDIQDIGTLQTHSSQAIAINNNSQILGWYNIDGSLAGKHCFVRDKDGTFSELPIQEKATNYTIDWRYLTDDGKAYGTFDGNANYAVLYVWDQQNGVVKLGSLPGKEIAAINNAGQVLLRSVVENENGKSIRRPIIWHNGKITKLHGLGGDLGIESEESYGLDMNNKGEVVGHSLVYLSYKNKIYTQKHAAKWVPGQVIDLHDMLSKNPASEATTINDLGDIVINGRLFRSDGGIVDNFMYYESKATSRNYFLNASYYSFVDRLGVHTQFSSKQFSDKNCIWRGMNNVIGMKMNDAGEAIITGITVYGEEHAMLLTPIKK